MPDFDDEYEIKNPPTPQPLPNQLGRNNNNNNVIPSIGSDDLNPPGIPQHPTLTPFIDPLQNSQGQHQGMYPTSDHPIFGQHQQGQGLIRELHLVLDLMIHLVEVLRKDHLVVHWVIHLADHWVVILAVFKLNESFLFSPLKLFSFLCITLLGLVYYYRVKFEYLVKGWIFLKLDIKQTM